jgi:ABC-type transporter Mla subunit MlaD
MKLAVGTFVIMLVSMLLVFFYLILKEKGAFETRYSYDFYAPSAALFKVGMPLQYSGFNIGVIDNIELTDKGNVHLKFSVSKENSKWICQYSILLLVKPLIGSPRVEILTTVGNPPLKPNSTLELAESDDINDMITKLQPAITKTINIIDNIEKITSTFSKEDGAFNNSIKNIEVVTGRFAQNKALLTTITGDQGSTDALIGSLNETQKTMKQVHEMSVKLDAIIGGLDSKMIKPSTEVLNNINVIMKDVQKKLQALDGTVNAVGGYDKDLGTIKEQIEVGLDKTNKVMDKVDALLNNNKKSEVTLP